MILRPYQLDAVARVLPLLREGRRVVLVAPTGSGKTVMGASVVASLGVRTRWTAHRRELIAQARAKLPASCDVFSVQERKTKPSTLLVVDECFPAGTLVDGRPIESVRVWDEVTAFDERTGRIVRSVVSHVMRREATALVAVHVGGRVVRCTPEHPFWTGDGWVPARLLSGRMVATIMRHEMHSMRERNRDAEPVSACDPPPRGPRLLLPRLLADMGRSPFVHHHGGDESEVCLGTHEGAQPDAQRDDAREGQDVVARDGMETSRPSRQRDRADGSATRACGGARVADGGGGSDARTSFAADASDLLQTRRRESDAEGRYRSGRALARRAIAADAGREEGRAPSFARVDRVEVLERGSDGTFGGVCPDGLVYNLEVRGVHTYTADGLIVHNCHHATSSSYRRHLDVHSGPVLGLTATPYRLDGNGLRAVFEELVVATTPAELVAAGTLVEPRYFSVGQVDASKLHKRAGDFVLEEIAAAMDKPRVVGDAVREYGERTPGSRAVVFCVTVEHAAHVAEAFRAAGHPAELVSGDMPRAERDAVLSRLASGATRVVANCMILTEGWDLPTLETAIILQPTTSLCLHLQMIGRIMRSADGKAGATVLDHAGNVKRLGFATDPIDFTLDGTTRGVGTERTNLKTCPDCYAILPNATAVCPCGHVFTAAEKDPDDVRRGLDGDERLTEVGGAAAPKPFVFRPDVWAEVKSVARSVGGAKYVYKQRTGDWPIVSSDGRLLDPASEEGQKRNYFELLEAAAARGRAIGWAAHVFKDRFGKWPSFEWRRKYEAWKADMSRSVTHG